LVPPEDPVALAAAISELLADPGERERLAQAARAAAAGPYSWDRVAERTIELYRELIA
jgi:starch synthase